MRNKKRIKRVLRQWIQQLEKIVNTCRVSIDGFLSKLIHQSTIERAALRNYTLINPINSLVDNSLRRQNFCIFERRIPRMLHKSFPATLSEFHRCIHFPYPLSPPLSLSLSSLSLLASCCTRQQLHASLANRRGPSLRATIDPVQISNRIVFRDRFLKNPSPRKFIAMSATTSNLWIREIRICIEESINYVAKKDGYKSNGGN